MKKEFETMTMEVVNFQNDIITTSGVMTAAFNGVPDYFETQD